MCNNNVWNWPESKWTSRQQPERNSTVVSSLHMQHRKPVSCIINLVHVCIVDGGSVGLKLFRRQRVVPFCWIEIKVCLKLLIRNFHPTFVSIWRHHTSFLPLSQMTSVGWMANGQSRRGHFPGNEFSLLFYDNVPNSCNILCYSFNSEHKVIRIKIYWTMCHSSCAHLLMGILLRPPPSVCHQWWDMRLALKVGAELLYLKKIFLFHEWKCWIKKMWIYCEM